MRIQIIFFIACMTITHAPIIQGSEENEYIDDPLANSMAQNRETYIHDIAHQKRGRPLATAIMTQNLEATIGLISSGASINDTFNGASMLQIAAKHSSPEIVNILLNFNADVNHTTLRKPKTALALACRRGQPKIVKALLNAGAFFYTKPHFSLTYKTPLQELIKGAGLSTADRIDDLTQKDNYLKSLNLLLKKRGVTERFYSPTTTPNIRWHHSKCTKSLCIFHETIGRTHGHAQLNEIQHALRLLIKKKKEEARYSDDNDGTLLLTEKKELKQEAL